MDAARDRRAPQQDAPRAELHASTRLSAAATMPWQPYGSLVPDRSAGAAVHDPPRAGRRRRRDHAVELAERAGHARRRAGPGARQCRRAQAGSADAGLRRGRLRRDLQGGRPARRPPPDRHRRRRDGRGARHRPERRHGQLHRVDRGRADSRRQGRRPAQEGQPGAGRQQPADRARRRRSAQPRRARAPIASFQFQGQVCFATGRHIVHRGVADEYVDLLAAEGTPAADGRSVPRGCRAGPDRQRAAAPARRRDRPALDPRAAARASSRAARTRACSTDPPF